MTASLTAPVQATVSVDFVPLSATTGTCGTSSCKTQFTATVSGSNSRPFIVKWDLGNDGSVEETCVISSGNVCRTSFALSEAGIFPVKANATDNTGSTAQVVHNVKVTRLPPLSIDPQLVGPSPILNPGDTFSVGVFVGNSTNPVNDLDGWQITLNYDPSILTAIAPSCGAEFGGPPCTAQDYAADPPFNQYGLYITPLLDDTIGNVTLGASHVNFPPVGPSGSGILARIGFVVDAWGNGPIRFLKVQLRSVVNSAIQVISPSAANDGFFSNVVDNPPIASFTVSPPFFERRVSTLITFDGSGSRDPDGFIINYIWNFDDQNTTTVIFPIITHRFAEQGTYNVTLTVTDNSTLKGYTSQDIAIVPQLPNEAPISSFIPSKFTVSPGEEVTFDARDSSDPDGCIVQFRWNFGDNSSLVLPDPSGGCLNLQGVPPPPGAVVTHVYSVPGYYLVSLVVVDENGATSSPSGPRIHVVLSHDVSVEQVEVEPDQIVSGQLVSFNVLLRNRGLNDETVSITVYYDSQVAASLIGIELQWPLSRSVSLLWNSTGVAAGNYTVSATVLLATDGNTSNNSLVGGRVRILPPPTVTLSPNRGGLGTRVQVNGSEFPVPQYGSGLASFTVTFDDMFLGFVIGRNGTFTFVFDVPHAEPGPHTVKAFDSFSGVRASTVFQVLASPVSEGALSVSVGTGAVYFPGDKADVFVLTTLNGKLTASQLILVLIRPDSSRITLNSTSPTIGFYRASYAIPKTASLGTYAVLATARLDDASAASLGSFQVKTSWLAAQGPRILSASAAIAGIGAVLAVAWRRGYLRRKTEGGLGLVVQCIW